MLYAFARGWWQLLYDMTIARALLRLLFSSPSPARCVLCFLCALSFIRWKSAFTALCAPILLFSSLCHLHLVFHNSPISCICTSISSFISFPPSKASTPIFRALYPTRDYQLSQEHSFFCANLRQSFYHIYDVRYSKSTNAR